MTAFVVILTVVAAVALCVIGAAIISADIHIARLEKRVEVLEKLADSAGAWALCELRHRGLGQYMAGGPVPTGADAILNGERLVPYPRPDLPKP